MMLENYRDATSTDVYICRGGEEVFQPKFTFHGYRYIEISGVEHAPELEEVESLQYSSVTEFHGSLTSSHKLLNRFAENVSWSQKCNFINIPTDCPQRNERMGWAGDTHIFCHTALNNSSLKKFYERNLQAMRDLQTPEASTRRLHRWAADSAALRMSVRVFLWRGNCMRVWGYPHTGEILSWHAEIYGLYEG